MNAQPGAARRRPSLARRLLGTVVVLVVTLAGLPSGPAVAATQSPASWAKSCSSAQLGLGRDHVELAPPLAGDTNPDGSRVAISADRRGKFVPVIVVHGWTSKDTHSPVRDGAFSHIIDLTANRLGQVNTTRSLIGQLQRDRGAAVFTFDYRDYAASWVDDTHLGPALGKVIDCLYRASGEKVIIVGHSMGGLIARYAATQRGLTGPDRTGEISTVITFGTPGTGSVAALLSNVAANSAAATSNPLAVLRLILAACGELSSTQIKTGTLCDSLPAPVRTFDSDAGRALRAGSVQLATLRPFPAGISVDALAGGATFDLPGAGWFALPWASTRVDVGDLIVTSGSATKGATTTRKVSCAYQLNGFRSVSDQISLAFGLVSKADVAQQPLAVFSGPCFHTQLMRGIELTNEATGAVTDDINSRLPRLSTDGYGPLRFGMTLAEAEAALGAPIATQVAGAGAGCLQGSSTAAPHVIFAVVDGKVLAAGTNTDVAQTVMTASGLHVGSSLADLKARVGGLTSQAYVSSVGVTEYDLKTASGRAAAFYVVDSTGKIDDFLFGDPRYVIGVEYICV
jgi:pimeloyl-ACP methyl ester carboxylesterase